MNALVRAACVRATVAACLLCSSACIRKAVVGSTCDGEGCPVLPECSEAVQQLPESCDRDAGTCSDFVVERDDVACDACYDMIDRLNVGSPVASCGCTYCAVQLTACFNSAETEENGDPERDQLCQAMVECGWAAGCAGSDCYCGEGVDRDTCLKNANEERFLGACAAVIQSAATCAEGELPGNCVLGHQLRANTAHARATEVAKCVSGDPLLQGLVIEPKCR
jgi:hypothetical protein